MRHKRHMHSREPRKNTCGAIRLHGRGLLIPSPMAKKSKEEREFEAHWKEIQKCIGTCAAAYAELVAAADKLADLTEQARFGILEECSPGGDCRDLLPALTQLWDKERASYRTEWGTRYRFRKRDELLDRLNLTDEEREILLWCASD